MTKEDDRVVAARLKIGRRMKKAREARKLLGREVAEKAGIHVNTYRLIESGKTGSQAVYVLFIAQALRVDAGWLLGQDLPKKKPG